MLKVFRVTLLITCCLFVADGIAAATAEQIHATLELIRTMDREVP